MTLTVSGCAQALPLCEPLSVALHGSAIQLYDSASYYDDLLWAAAWMYRATGVQPALSAPSHTFCTAHTDPPAAGNGTDTSPHATVVRVPAVLR